MRKKYTDETYLRGVSKYDVTTKKLKGQDTYIVIKKIQEIDEPFIRNVTLIDNGYYIVEYTPLDRLYNARAFIDNELKTIKSEECNFEYRNSKFKNSNLIIIKAILKLQKGNIAEIKQKMDEYKQFRIEKQPIEYPSAGSTFKRGTDFITAKLIDDAGLKGFTIGGAQVSEKHAGFIINKNNATATDIINLIEEVQKIVYEKFNKKIELEIEII